MHELRHIDSEQSDSRHRHRHRHHTEQVSLIVEQFGKQDTSMKSPHFFPSFRDLSVNSARHRDSSSDSDNHQDSSAFLRATVHTTRRTDQDHSSSASLNSVSASSAPSSVASSQEFQGLRASSEIESPAQSLVFETGIQLR